MSNILNKAFALALLVTPLALFGNDVAHRQLPISNSKSGTLSVSYANGADLLGKKLVALGHKNGAKVTMYKNNFNQTVEKDGRVSSSTTLAFEFDDGEIAFVQVESKNGKTTTLGLDYLHTLLATRQSLSGGGTGSEGVRGVGGDGPPDGNDPIIHDPPADGYYMEFYDPFDGEVIAIEITDEMWALADSDPDQFAEAVADALEQETAKKGGRFWQWVVRNRACIVAVVGTVVSVVMSDPVGTVLGVIDVIVVCF